MANGSNGMQTVSPAKVLREIAEAMPGNCRDKVTVIGSLAAGYYFFKDQAEMEVRTKDADCLLSPRVEAIPSGIAITDQLMDAGWTYNPASGCTGPGDAKTPDAKLPAVRLLPPGKTEWFIELLTVPENSDTRGRRWLRIETKHGHFGLPSFGFLSLANYEPISTELGIYIARPEMMALANLLEHPVIGTDVMSGGFAGLTGIKRSNKDIGRVLALARLAVASNEDALLAWPAIWLAALKKHFPAAEWPELARRAGQGLRALLASEPDLEQALHTCVNGLLTSNPPTLDILRITGKRLLTDVIEPLEKEAEQE
jgi:hypothetical protein